MTSEHATAAIQPARRSIDRGNALDLEQLPGPTAEAGDAETRADGLWIGKARAEHIGDVVPVSGGVHQRDFDAEDVRHRRARLFQARFHHLERVAELFAGVAGAAGPPFGIPASDAADENEIPRADRAAGRLLTWLR